jgi:hypothetical protein
MMSHEERIVSVETTYELVLIIFKLRIVVPPREFFTSCDKGLAKANTRGVQRVILQHGRHALLYGDSVIPRRHTQLRANIRNIFQLRYR